MTQRRFVLVDFRYTSEVVGHIRLYEAGNTYDMPRALAHAAAKRELIAVQRARQLGTPKHPEATRGAHRSGIRGSRGRAEGPATPCIRNSPSRARLADCHELGNGQGRDVHRINLVPPLAKRAQF
jgi:hypothetical protein